MAKHTKKRVLKAAPKEPFPWLAFLGLVVTIGLFWVLPHQLGSPPVKVDFAAVRRPTPR